MNAERWIVATGRPNGNGSPPAVLYKFADRTAKLVYKDGSFTRFRCVRCAVVSERLQMADGPKIVNVDG